MAPTSLPLSIIADVTVVTTSPQVAAPTFNTGLVVGNSGVIPTIGANARIRKYLAATYSTAMMTDGFTNGDPEFICAQMYFSQSPQPQAIFIGAQDPTAIQTVVPHTGSIGTGYVVGDTVTPTQGGASGALLRVAAVGAGGTVTTLTTQVGYQGTGYSIASGLPTTTSGIGTGLEVDITAIGESCLQAFQACRIANAQWYPGMVTTAVAADHIAISAWTQSQVGTTYFGNSQETNVLNGIAGNTFKTIYAANNSRTWMQWASTQSGLVPNQAYFTASVMGQAMASNTQLTNSAFTEKFSGGVPLVGVVVEPNLSITQIGNIEGTTPAQGPNGNLYLNYGDAFNVLEQGTMMAENVFFDQVLNLDILASNIQFAILDLLTSVPKVPQTNAGQQLLIQAVESALAVSANTGFIAPGTWEGQTVLAVSAGTPLPTGYAAQSPLYSTLDQAQIQARQAPPIYVTLIEAGAVHFVTIQVLVQI
jgi:Protein of unknown function (DUF3383)